MIILLIREIWLLQNLAEHSWSTAKATVDKCGNV